MRSAGPHGAVAGLRRDRSVSNVRRMTTGVSTKGERTRERIVQAAAPLFNRRGYTGVSMTDLMAATGLEKGGLYRHFASKDDIALAAFEHNVAQHRARIQARVEDAAGAVARLAALVDALADVARDPVVPGGCPLLNTAVEADDGDAPLHAELRARARRGMRRLIRYAQALFEDGVAAGELAADVDCAAEAEALVASMEGAVVLSRLYGDARFARAAARRAAAHVARLAR